MVDKGKTKLNLTILLSAVIIGIFILLGFLILKSSLTGKSVDGEKLNKNNKGTFLGEKFVTKVIDGDTVIIEGDSVRLLGIDADERGYPCYDDAKLRLEELVLNKKVLVEKDIEDKDQYGRYLRYLFLDNQNINLKLVEEGFAVSRFTPENVKYKTEIVEAEKRARENKVGCKWQASVPESISETDIVWKELTEEKSGLEVIGACSSGKYIGEKKIVEGKVVDAYKSKTNTVFLNLEKAYPNPCFTAVIFSSDLYKFPENAEKYYYGKTVRIQGQIEQYESKPEIILDTLEQVEVGV